MTWLDGLLDRFVEALAARVSRRWAQLEARTDARIVVAIRTAADAAASEAHILESERRLMLALQEARTWSQDVGTLRKLIVLVGLVGLAGEQLLRRAAVLEQLDREMMRKVDRAILQMAQEHQRVRALDTAERLRLNEQAEKWRKLAMIHLEAELDEMPPTGTISKREA